MAQTARQLQHEPQVNGQSSAPLTIQRVDTSSAHLVKKLFVCGIIALLVFAVVAGARVWLSSGTAETLIKTDEITSELESARSNESTLEIQLSTLSNPTHIKDQASKLGMIESDEVTYMDAEELASGEDSSSTPQSKVESDANNSAE